MSFVSKGSKATIDFHRNLERSCCSALERRSMRVGSEEIGVTRIGNLGTKALQVNVPVRVVEYAVNTAALVLTRAIVD